MNKIYMILIYPDYPVDPVKKKEIPILLKYLVNAKKERTSG